MEESGNNQRLIVAAVLCMAVLLGWQFLFPPKRPPRRPPEAGAVATGTAAGKQDQLAGSPGTPSAGVAGAPGASATATHAAARAAEPATFHFSGAVPGGREGVAAVPFELTLSNVGGGIEEFELPSFRERDKSNKPTEQPISLARPLGNATDLTGQMAGISFLEGTTFEMPPKPVYEVVEQRESFIRYRFVTASGVEIEREYDLKQDTFEIELAVTVRNRSDKPQKERLMISTAAPLTEAQEGGGFFLMPPPDHLNAICYSDGKVQREPQQSLKKETETFRESVKWVGVDRQYFLAAIIQRDSAEAECRLWAKDRLAISSLVMPETTLNPGEEKRHKFTAFLGVKKPELLTRVDEHLESAIDYTILGLNLAILAEGLLAILGLMHKLFDSWGWAILGLTVIVKAVLFPLNQRSGRSMRAMAELKPEIEKLKVKYTDRQRQSEELMKLYRKHNVNPASGCVPILIQMPIWFALYRALWVSVDLFQQPFLWIPDLTARDPYWILPVALVIVMFVQQKMTPNTMDPAQQKMMLYVMPLLFGSMMAALPAGLCFYIFVNSVLTIGQQHFINRSIGPVGGSGTGSVPGATA